MDKPLMMKMAAMRRGRVLDAMATQGGKRPAPTTIEEEAWRRHTVGQEIKERRGRWLARERRRSAIEGRKGKRGREGGAGGGDSCI